MSSIFSTKSKALEIIQEQQTKKTEEALKAQEKAPEQLQEQLKQAERSSEQIQERTQTQQTEAREAPQKNQTAKTREQQKTESQKQQRSGYNFSKHSRSMPKRALAQLQPRGPRSWAPRNSPRFPTQLRQSLRHVEAKPMETHSQESLLKGNKGELASKSKTETQENKQALDKLIQYSSPKALNRRMAQTILRSNTNNLAQKLQKMVQQAKTNQAQSRAKTQGVLTALRNGFALIPQSKAMQMFKWRQNKFHEIATRRGSGRMLDSQGRAILRVLYRKRGLDSQQRPPWENPELSLEQAAEELAQQVAKESGKKDEALEEGLKFAAMLFLALERDKVPGKKLKPGQNPNFPEGKDLEAALANIAQRGSVEKRAKKSMDLLKSLLFRGVTNKAGKGAYLVGDLKFLKGNRTRTDAFIQLLIDNPKLLAYLKTLKPGQSIDAQILQEFFGEELEYLKLAHQEESHLPMGEEGEKNIQYNPKAQVDPYAQARLEKSLFGDRKNPIAKESQGKDMLPSLAMDMNPKGIFANVFELLGKRETQPGKMKFYTWLTYAVIGGTIGLGMLWATMKLF